MNKEIMIRRPSEEELEIIITYRSTHPQMLDLMERKYEAEQRASNDSKRWQDNTSD